MSLLLKLLRTMKEPVSQSKDTADRLIIKRLQRETLAAGSSSAGDEDQRMNVQDSAEQKAQQCDFRSKCRKPGKMQMQLVKK